MNIARRAMHLVYGLPVRAKRRCRSCAKPTFRRSSLLGGTDQDNFPRCPFENECIRASHTYYSAPTTVILERLLVDIEVPFFFSKKHTSEGLGSAVAEVSKRSDTLPVRVGS